jgi:hypothetical protein
MHVLVYNARHVSCEYVVTATRIVRSTVLKAPLFKSARVTVRESAVMVPVSYSGGPGFISVPGDWLC